MPTSKPKPFDYSEPALALADALAGALRGTTTTATGFYGDIEDLVRKYGKGVPANAIRMLLSKREGKETLLPTVEEMNAMLPPVVPKGAGRSSQVANVYNDLAMANPLAPAAGELAVRGAKAAAPIIKAGALDLAKSEPARRAVQRVAKVAGVSPMELMAYQGSPHMFAPTAKNPLGELDPSKIGTGEGAQAYGHGHYLAQNKNVGQGYRTSISAQHNQDTTIAGKPVHEYYQNIYDAAHRLPTEEARQQYDKAALIEMLGFNRSPGEVLSYAEDMGYAPSVIDWFKNTVTPKVKLPGHLYTHDLSDEAIAKMLDYDLPLKSQPHIIEAIGKHYDPEVFLQQLELSPESTGGDFQSALQGPRTAERIKQASETLRSKFGIPGVKYLDEESKAKQAMDPSFTDVTRNFVLFPGEEGASKIIRREKAGGAVIMADGDEVYMGAGGAAKKALEKATPVIDNAIKDAVEGLRNYIDPIASKISDWNWRPMEEVRQEVPTTEVPEYIQKGYGDFMAEQAKRAAAGDLNARDLIKAYTITRSSVNRGGLPYTTATKTGMQLPQTKGLVRPEGAFSEWLGSKAGQRYLDMAEKGQFDEHDLDDMMTRFAPFGMPAVLADDMRYAARSLSPRGATISNDVLASPEVYREVSQQLKGIGPAKSGFMASLLGRGDYPTFDARQIRLHTGQGGKDAAKYMTRGKGVGGEEAVARLADRQRAMNMSLDPSLDPFYQHLVHHTVWDKLGNEQTTHDDLVRAMRGYADGGEVGMDDSSLTLDDFLSKQGY